MKLLAFADLQATEGAERCFHNPTLPLQRFRVSKFLDQLVDIYHRFECQGLLDLGDTTDDRAFIPMPTISSMLPKFQKLCAAGAANYKLLGNHEQYEKSGLVHSGPLYSRLFHTVQDHEVATLTDCKLVMISFPADERTLAKTIEKIGAELSGQRTILIGHFQVSGAQMDSGPALTGLRLSALKSFGLVLLGHIHMGQSLATNVHYIGSPFQQHFGESGQAKRVAIVDTATLSVEWVETVDMPRYHTATLETFLSEISDASEDRYKVILKSSAEVERFFTHPLAGRAMPIYQFDLQAEQQAGQREDHNWLLSPRELLLRYTARVAPQSHGIEMPIQDLVNLGLQITEEC